MSKRGKRKAQASRVLVGEVQRPPVTASAPLRYIVVSWLIILNVPEFLVLECTFRGGPHQTSVPYKILGSAMPIYRQHVYLGVMPQLSLVILQICRVHLVPFSIVYAC